MTKLEKELNTDQKDNQINNFLDIMLEILQQSAKNFHFDSNKSKDKAS